MRTKIAAGIGLTVSSCVLMVLSGYLVLTTIDQSSRNERARIATDKQCVALLKTIPGSEVTVAADDVSVLVRNVFDPRKALDDMTTAVLMCPGRRLAEPCIGDKCQGSQDKVIMRFKMKGAF